MRLNESARSRTSRGLSTTGAETSTAPVLMRSVARVSAVSGSTRAFETRRATTVLAITSRPASTNTRMA